MDEAILFGQERPDAAAPQLLHAGPLRMKFQDGELRYICAGNREIVRRIYFAVRDSKWDTVMPRISAMEVKNTAMSFEINFVAVSKNDFADYRWAGRITGASDGKIIFAVKGAANAEFESPRVGICVLYGAAALAGRPYTVYDDANKATSGEFPHEVTPGLLAEKFKLLRYDANAGVTVSCGIEGGVFGMEDQRNFCDTSYKAFGSMPYPRKVPAGVEATQTVTLETLNAKGKMTEDESVHLTVGKVLPDARMPVLTQPPAGDAKPQTFVALNGGRKKHEGDATIAWAFNPAAHLPDDDTFMENIPSVIDQARTVRSFAPRAHLLVLPISIDSPYPRPGPDARNTGLFAAAWSADMVRCLALAGVDEAAFKVGPGMAAVVQDALGAYAGKNVLEVQSHGIYPVPVTALAVKADGGVDLWLINKSAVKQRVLVDKLPDQKVHLQRFNAQAARLIQQIDAWASSAGGTLEVQLDPLETCKVPLKVE